MSKQAVCLIDDAKFHIAGIATSWDYDDRATRSQYPFLSDAGCVCSFFLRKRNRLSPCAPKTAALFLTALCAKRPPNQALYAAKSRWI